MSNKNNDDLMNRVLNKLDKLDDKMDAKLSKVEDRLDSMDKTLVKQEANLAEHMRRTDLLEKDMAPVKKHVTMVNGALKLVGLIGVVVGIIAGILKIIAGV